MLPFQGGTSFVDHLCFLCLVFAMFSRLFIAALLSPEGKWLTSWLLFVMLIVILLRTSDTLKGYRPIFQMLPKTSLYIRDHWYPFQ